MYSLFLIIVACINGMGENIQKLMKSLDEKMTEKYPDGFTQEDIKYAELDNDKVVEINYTSGTTGFSKGLC